MKVRFKDKNLQKVFKSQANYAKNVGKFTSAVVGGNRNKNRRIHNDKKVHGSLIINTLRKTGKSYADSLSDSELTAIMKLLNDELIQKYISLNNISNEYKSNLSLLRQVYKRYANMLKLMIQSNVQAGKLHWNENMKYKNFKRRSQYYFKYIGLIPSRYIGLDGIYSGRTVKGLKGKVNYKR